MNVIVIVIPRKIIIRVYAFVLPLQNSKIGTKVGALATKYTGFSHKKTVCKKRSIRTSENKKLMELQKILLSVDKKLLSLLLLEF